MNKAPGKARDLPYSGAQPAARSRSQSAQPNLATGAEILRPCRMRSGPETESSSDKSRCENRCAAQEKLLEIAARTGSSHSCHGRWEEAFAQPAPLRTLPAAACPVPCACAAAIFSGC